MKKNKNKKKGSLIVEQVLVFPIMIGIIWLIMQMIIFVYSNNQVNTAANETSQVLSQILRGTDKTLVTLNATNRGLVIDESLKKIINVSEKNGFIMMTKDKIENKNYLWIDSTTGNATGFITYSTAITGLEEKPLVIVENQNLCKTTLDDPQKRRVICIYTEESTAVGDKESQQMVVRLKAPFHLIGSIIPGVDKKILLYGNGVSTKELTGRYQYY
jgi:hypothetical protein